MDTTAAVADCSVGRSVRLLDPGGLLVQNCRQQQLSSSVSPLCYQTPSSGGLDISHQTSSSNLLSSRLDFHDRNINNSNNYPIKNNNDAPLAPVLIGNSLSAAGLQQQHFSGININFANKNSDLFPSNNINHSNNSFNLINNNSHNIITKLEEEDDKRSCSIDVLGGDNTTRNINASTGEAISNRSASMNDTGGAMDDTEGAVDDTGGASDEMPSGGDDESVIGDEDGPLLPRYKCDTCTKEFTVPARLLRHQRIHTGEKPFRCEYCHKTFSVKENLNVHRRIHTKERPYTCSICSRAFEHSGKLHRHMRTHTGERPHKCERCGKTFVQSGQLVIHMRAHTGEKPYCCEYCDKAFTCSKQLKVHLRTHTGEKPYGCDICGKMFGYNHVLKMHKMSHLGEKLYKCTLCDKFFNSRKSLDNHIKDHASDSDESVSSSNGSSSKSDDLPNNNVRLLLQQETTTSSIPGNSSSVSFSSAAESISKPRKRKATSTAQVVKANQKQNFSPISPLDNQDEPLASLPQSNQIVGGRFSPASDYVSDDSGRGNSPITITPPTSPDIGSADSSPRYVPSSSPPSSPSGSIVNPSDRDSPSNINSHDSNNIVSNDPVNFRPSPVNNGTHYNPEMQDQLLRSYNHHMRTPGSPIYYPPSTENISNKNNMVFNSPSSIINHSKSTKLSEVCSKISPSSHHGIADMHSAGRYSPHIPVDQESRMSYPFNLLSNFEGNVGSPHSMPTMLLKKELEVRLAREESKRLRETKFCSNVVKVLQSLLGEDRMVQMGYPQASLDEIIQRTLERMHSQPCTEPSLSYMDRVKVNLRLLLDCCVPDKDMWKKFGWKGKSIEDIVNEFLQFC